MAELLTVKSEQAGGRVCVCVLIGKIHSTNQSKIPSSHAKEKARLLYRNRTTSLLTRHMMIERQNWKNKNSLIQRTSGVFCFFFFFQRNHQSSQVNAMRTVRDGMKKKEELMIEEKKTTMKTDDCSCFVPIKHDNDK